MFLNMGLFYQIIKIKLKDTSGGGLMIVSSTITKSSVGINHGCSSKSSGEIFVDKDDG